METNETTVAPESITAVVVKSFAASLATTAGMIVALGAFGKVLEHRSKKVQESTETPESE